MKYTDSVVISLLTAGACFAQTITTIAGTPDGGFGGDGGPAKFSQLSGPASLAADSAGSLYVNDTNNVRVRKVSPDGTIGTVAGSGDASEPVVGPATQSGFISIYDIAVDPAGILYLADADGLQRVDGQGILSFVVTGTSVPGVTISNAGAIYLGGISTVSRLEKDGSVTQIAGTDLGDWGDGGPATEAAFYVNGLATDRSGSIFIVDGQASRVRVITPDGTISTLAGNGVADFGGDGGPANQAALSGPTGIAVDEAGSVYISDTGNFRIRKVTPNGTISTFAGTGDSTYDGDGGPALQATLGYPANLAVSCTALYINDSNRIRAIALTAPLIAQGGVVVPAIATAKAAGQFSITGCNLGGATAKADPAAASVFTLAGASVTVNGTPVALLAVSPTQITAVLPASLAPGIATVSVLVNGNGTVSATVSVN